MSATLPVRCVLDDAGNSAIGRLVLHCSSEGDRCVIQVAGELDAASSGQLVVASTTGSHPAMVIDLAGITFMDCSGYGSLEAARCIVERDGRTFATRGQTGQPARLFELIAALAIDAVDEKPRGRRARCAGCA